MAKFRKKPVVIDAEQFDPNATNWPEGVVVDNRSPTGYSIGTLENTAQGHEVTPGDWIITGVKGEKYPCKDDVFRQTYEPVEPLSVTMLSEPGYGRSRLIDREEIIEIDDAGNVSLVAAAAADEVTTDQLQVPDSSTDPSPYPAPVPAACETTWDQTTNTGGDVCVTDSISFDSGSSYDSGSSGGGFDPGN